MKASRENAKPTLIRRVLACLVSAAMVVAFTPVVAWGGTQVGDFTVSGGVSGTDYAYENNTLTIKSSTPITISNTDPNTATTDHIVVNTGVTANITLSGVNIVFENITPSNTNPLKNCAFKINSGAKVNLTLAGDNILTSNDGNAGLHVSQGSELTITGGSTDSLSATSYNGGAGIGGSRGGSGGSVTINGGTVTATGVGNGAGIGGGGAGSGGSVTINGGTVTATGGDSGGAGIGGGSGDTGGAGGSVTITGGTVTATGGDSGGAGIGGGFGGDPENGSINSDGGTLIHIGGTVTGNNGNPVTCNATAGVKPENNSTLKSFGDLALPVDLTIKSSLADCWLSHSYSTGS